MQLAKSCTLCTQQVRGREGRRDCSSFHHHHHPYSNTPTGVGCPHDKGCGLFCHAFISSAVPLSTQHCPSHYTLSIIPSYFCSCEHCCVFTILEATWGRSESHVYTYMSHSRPPTTTPPQIDVRKLRHTMTVMIPSPRQVEQKSKERETRGYMEDTLLNLCVEPFVVRCEATSVNADGYPPSNLISSDRAAQARGFQMEHFVRPPVTLEVSVSRRVRVAFLVLHVPLPEGAECRLEVFGSPGGEGDGPYTHCAGVTLKGCDVLFLRNRSYVGQIADGVPSATKVIGSYLPPDLSDRDRMEQPFKSCSALGALRRLKVSVSWLSGHLPLKVKAMELWGIPCERDVARGLSDSLRERTADCRFTNVFNSRSFGGEEEGGGSVSLVHGSQTTLCTHCASCGSDQCACDPHGTFLGTLERGEEEEGKGQRLDSKGDCPFFLRGTDRAQSVAATPTTLTPSRLLDEITCDVMQVPMLLPSGHYVDHSTVDKLEQMDLLYGRRPCDPFTGE